METDSFAMWLLAAARAIHFAACLLLFGAPLFDRVIVGRAVDDLPSIVARWRSLVRWLIWTSLIVALVSGIGWLCLNAIAMSGLPPGEAVTWETLRLVLTGTHFGFLWEIRAAVWLVALSVAAPMFLALPKAFLAALMWYELFVTAIFSASLAWAGHGLTGGPQPLHIWADAIHILIGGLWPMGLLPFALLFALLHKISGNSKWVPIASITRRFSATSLASVAILLITGLVNSWSLVGSPSLLLSTNYGRILLAKVAAFSVMFAIGSVNLLRLKPRLTIDFTEGTATLGEMAARRLRANVLAELLVALIVLGLVGLLGLLPPASEAMLHHHH